MLVINIFEVSVMLVLALSFFLAQLHNLCDDKAIRVKDYLIAGLVVSAVAMVSAFIAIKMGV